MRESLLSLLSCPYCGGEEELEQAEWAEGEIREGELGCRGCKARYPIRNFIPRFVDGDNYARGFGFQWNRHARTQVDKFNGTQISTKRFYAGTEWSPDDLRGKKILEVGCGAGRFTDVMLQAGVDVYSLDYSNAVDACLANHGLKPNFHLVQADIYRIPFKKEYFDRVFCFGVLQHTPDVRRSFLTLSEFLRPGGKIAVDIYPDTLKTRLHYPRYLLRPLTKRLPPPILYYMVVQIVRYLLPISIALKRIPGVGRYLYPLMPVANYWGTLPLSQEMLREWAIIDTFDWLASWYDQPQKATTVENWFKEAGLVNIRVKRQGSYVITGEKLTIGDSI